MVKYFATSMLYTVLTIVGAFGLYVLIQSWHLFTPTDKAFIFSISTILVAFYSLIWGMHIRNKRHENHMPNDKAGH